MKKTRLGWKQGWAAALAVGALLAGPLASPADAALTLTLQSGGSSTTVTDNDADGVVNFAGALGTFTTNISTALSKPTLIGKPTLLDLLSVNVSGGAGTMKITAADDGYTNGLPLLKSLRSNIGGTTNNIVTWDAYVDPTNTKTLVGATKIFSGVFSTGAFSGSGGVKGLNITGPYSLITVATIQHSRASQVTSFDGEITIPTPTTLALLGSGLLGIGLLGRKRRKESEGAAA